MSHFTSAVKLSCTFGLGVKVRVLRNLFYYFVQQFID